MKRLSLKKRTGPASAWSQEQGRAIRQTGMASEQHAAGPAGNRAGSAVRNAAGGKQGPAQTGVHESMFAGLESTAARSAQPRAYPQVRRSIA